MIKQWKRTSNKETWINTSEDWVLRTAKSLNDEFKDKSDNEILLKISKNSNFSLGSFFVKLENVVEEGNKKSVVKKKATSKKKATTKKKSSKKRTTKKTDTTKK